MIGAAVLMAGILASPQAGIASTALVDAAEIVPGLVLDIRYATPRNFLKRKVYAAPRCLLREDVARRLARVQANLAHEGLGLKVFDCYRPLSVQKAMWALKPVKGYVADPSTGSNHNRGAAVDAALVDVNGKALPMPTDFDTFGHASYRDAPVADVSAARNRARLRAAMEAEGFGTIKMEWWHFDAPGASTYPLLDTPLDQSGEPASKTPASSK
jgi:zinc D-Ala-D-Ala dipeptidase